MVREQLLATSRGLISSFSSYEIQRKDRNVGDTYLLSIGCENNIFYLSVLPTVRHSFVVGDIIFRDSPLQAEGDDKQP
jgi:hypothetical protein